MDCRDCEQSEIFCQSKFWGEVKTACRPTFSYFRFIDKGWIKTVSIFLKRVYNYSLIEIKPTVLSGWITCKNDLLCSRSQPYEYSKESLYWSNDNNQEHRIKREDFKPFCFAFLKYFSGTRCYIELSIAKRLQLVLRTKQLIPERKKRFLINMILQYRCITLMMLSASIHFSLAIMEELSPGECFKFNTYK